MSDNVLLNGGIGDDLLTGGDGHDTLWGGLGNDTLVGGLGNDLLYGDEGNDWMDGGAGDDSFYTGGGAVGSGNDTMMGGDGNDYFGMAFGNNYLYGENGDDTLDGGEDSDWMDGGLGNDLLHGGDGNDWMDGGDGNDSIHGDNGDDTLYGGLGDDTMHGGMGNDSLYGGDGIDYLDGSDGNDYLEGGAGNDTVLGGQNGGSDTLYGNTGDDHINGIDGDDFLYGGDGNDTLYGEAGNDVMYGGAGNDSILSGAGDNGNDTLFGEAGNDSLDGGSGNDILSGGDGIDWLDGGNGSDTVDYSDKTDSVTVTLNGSWNATVYVNGSAEDTIRNIENVFGGSGDDVLTGDGVDNIIDGGSGNDMIRGGDGLDVIYGGEGNDNLQGGPGEDTLTGGTGNDIIDGRLGTDTAVFSGNFTDYTFTYDVGANILTINDTVIGRDGTDVISDVESFQFADTTKTADALGVVKVISDKGLVTTDFGGGVDGATGVALQSDGKIILAGATYINGSSADFSLLRYNVDGSLDTSFSGDGKLATAFGGSMECALSVVEQSDHKILAVGQSYNGIDYVLALARYNPDGTLDADFGGGDGKVSGDICPVSVSLQSDGKILVAGNDLFGHLAIARFNSDGTPDSSLGGGSGIVSSGGVQGRGTGVAELSNGNILVTGSVWNGFNTDFALARLTSSGTLDTSFGINGTVITDFNNGEERCQSMAVQSDGKILLSGFRTNGANSDFALARYNVNGSLDTSFGGGDGKIVTDLGVYDQGYSMTVQSDGKIIVSGHSDAEIALVRYTVDGSLDTTFSNDGIVTVDIGAAININGNVVTGMGVTVQSNGKILVTGQSNGDLALVRFNNDGTLDTSFSSGHRLQGTAFNDLVYGYGGNDTLSGGAGADTLDGGDGVDWADYGGKNGAVTVTLNGSQNAAVFVNGIAEDTVRNIENVFGGSGNDSLTGDVLDNILYGGSGNDSLAGGDGYDTAVFRGNVADYSIRYDVVLSRYTIMDNVSGRDGTDNVTSVERIWFADGFLPDLTDDHTAPTLSAVTPTDNASAVAVDSNIVITFSEVVQAGTGNIVITNGNGDTRTISVTNSGQVTISGKTVTINPTNNLNPGTNYNVQLASGVIKDLAGNSYAGISDSTTLNFVTKAVTYTGTASADVLNGSANNDILNGLGGNDKLNGNDGDDLLDGGAGHDSLSGGAGDDTLFGRAGNDSLQGGAGSDLMQGGADNDFYYVDSLGDVVVEYASEGTDIVYASVSFLLGDNVENLTLQGTGNINGTGNSANNSIVGNSGNNILTDLAGGNDVLDGGTGSDSMSGGTGNDIYYVDNAGDLVTEQAGEGSDTVNASVSYTLTANVESLTLQGRTNINGTGNIGNNTIIGNTGNNALVDLAGNDSLNGGAGNDTLAGGDGADLLTGGTGNDIFRYTAESESGTAPGTMDTITDFVKGQDRLDLSGIDADIALAGDQAFLSTILGAQTQFTLAGQLRFDGATGTLYGNTNSDVAAEFAILLSGVVSVDASNFVL
jgi:uncharacterized delta-60 repeat protein